MVNDDFLMPRVWPGTKLEKHHQCSYFIQRTFMTRIKYLTLSRLKPFSYKLFHFLLNIHSKSAMTYLFIYKYFFIIVHFKSCKPSNVPTIQRKSSDFLQILKLSYKSSTFLQTSTANHGKHSNILRHPGEQTATVPLSN